MKNPMNGNSGISYIGEHLKVMKIIHGNAEETCPGIRRGHTLIV